MLGSGNYEKTSVQGVECFVWKIPLRNAKLPSAQLRQLKKEKHELGSVNKEIPILDSCRYGAKVEFCDIILHSQHLQLWHNALTQIFNSCTEIKKSLCRGNYKVVGLYYDASKQEDALIVHIYPSKEKMMIQPGKGDEQVLLDVLRMFPDIRNSFNESPNPSPSSSSETAQAQAQVSLVTQVSATPTAVQLKTAPGTSSTHRASPTLNTNLQDRECPPSNIESTQTGIQLIPVIPRSPNRNMRTDKEPVNIAISELLCYLQNQLNTTPIEDVINICMNFYDDDTILKAKQHFYDHVSVKTGDHNEFKFVKRIGQNKKRVNIEDIVKLFLNVPINEIPTFVARDLTKIPPMPTSTTELYSLCDDLRNIKCELGGITRQMNDKLNCVKDITHITPKPLDESNTTTPTNDIPPPSTVRPIDVQSPSPSTLRMHKLVISIYVRGNSTTVPLIA